MSNELTTLLTHHSLLITHYCLSNLQPRAVHAKAVEVAERGERQPFRSEILARDALQVFERDRLETADHFVGRDAAAVDDLLPRQGPGTHARRFEPEQDGGDGLVLDELELRGGHALAHGAA